MRSKFPARASVSEKSQLDEHFDRCFTPYPNERKLTKRMRTRLKSLCCSTLFGRLAGCAAVILICSSGHAQNLFVSAAELDSSGFAVGGKIFEITPEGTQSIFASGLGYAGGLAFDSAGNLFVIDFSNSSNVPVTASILKFTPDGLRSIFASGLVNPFALAFDSAGNLFVTDGGVIYKFTPAGVRTIFATVGLGANGLAFDQAGNLFVGAGGGGFSKTAEIYKFTPDGVRTTFASELYSPNALAFDSRGNLFVADHGGPPIYDWPPVVDAAVYRFTPSGQRSTVASQNKRPRVFPNALAIDSADNLFVTDGSYEILKFTRSGKRSVFASGFLGGSLAFQPAQTPTPTPTSTPSATPRATPTPTATPAMPAVSLKASPRKVNKGGTATFTASASMSDPFDVMVVNFSTSGKAVNGTDYTLSANQITIPAGQFTGSVTLQVTTAKTKGREKAVMTLQPGTGYTVVAKHKVAKVIIHNK